jgi:hypothetical protein
MSQSAKSLLLEEEIALLVKHFGVHRIQAALAKVPVAAGEERLAPTRKAEPRGQRPIRATVAQVLESIRDRDPEKHILLTEFLRRLQDREILPESQDIRHFAQIVGLKDIGGKSRRDLVPKLMRFLLEQPIERLRVDIQSAGGISERQRQMGFSILTDKLVGKS